MVNLSIMQTIANRLRWAREQTGLSARALSVLVEASPALVGLIERGDVESPRLETLSALADALGTTVGWLLAGEGEPPTPEAILAAVERARAAVAARTPSEPPAPEVPVARVA